MRFHDKRLTHQVLSLTNRFLRRLKHKDIRAICDALKQFRFVKTHVSKDKQHNSGRNIVSLSDNLTSLLKVFSQNIAIQVFLQVEDTAQPSSWIVLENESAGAKAK